MGDVTWLSGQSMNGEALEPERSVVVGYDLPPMQSMQRVVETCQ